MRKKFIELNKEHQILKGKASNLRDVYLEGQKPASICTMAWNASVDPRLAL